MKQSPPYKFTSMHGLSLHDDMRVWLLHDSNDSNINTDAHVRSGDYFSTLATILDDLTEKLPTNSDEVLRLERCVRDLLYVDSKYKIVAKQKTEPLL